MKCPRRAFTLIELLVAMAIIATVMGLLLSAVQRVREAARRTECLNKIRQQALAILHYESTTGYLPPGAVQGPNAQLGIPAGAGHGMWAFLLPHLEQVPLANNYRLNLRYDHPDNQPVANTRLTMLLCSNSDPNRIETFTAGGFGSVADYVPIEVNAFLADLGMIDPVKNFESALPANKQIRLADITDGTSNTILLLESGGRSGVAWCSPLVPTGLREVFAARNGTHRNGSPGCLADGSARFFPDSMSIRILGRLATRAGGEVIGDW